MSGQRKVQRRRGHRCPADAVQTPAVIVAHHEEPLDQSLIAGGDQRAQLSIAPHQLVGEKGILSLTFEPLPLLIQPLPLHPADDSNRSEGDTAATSAQSETLRMFTGIAILNGEDQTTEVQVQAFSETGVKTAERTVVLEPGHRLVERKRPLLPTKEATPTRVAAR